MKRFTVLMIACLLVSAMSAALADVDLDAILAQDTSAISVVAYGSDTQLTDKYGTYYVSNCFDNNLKTCWAEGVSGDGIGSGIWGRWQVNRGRWLLKGVAIWGGYQKSEDVYYKNGRPRDVTLEVWCDGATRTIEATLDDLPRCNLILFDEYMPFYGEAEVFLTLDSVYLGSKYHDTCITDIDLLVDTY